MAHPSTLHKLTITIGAQHLRGLALSDQMMARPQRPVSIKTLRGRNVDIASARGILRPLPPGHPSNDNHGGLKCL
ncbi:hypothetical protein CTRI78_v009302 [Colletotrichum trifolii]|uniref:Uncharacterized protein n=1 Tax=Colletotrichum trifolii TaxID=5466 RepID=A0A4R8QR03_COLTR|nr:hypothetical protein CTRI78_v009302 [Colletotrichum trifolii]